MAFLPHSADAAVVQLSHDLTHFFGEAILAIPSCGHLYFSFVPHSKSKSPRAHSQNMAWRETATIYPRANGTFVGTGSSAANSILYVKGVGTFSPPNPGGPGITYTSVTYTPAATGSYVCTQPNPNPVNVFFYGAATPEMTYNYVTSAYRYVAAHPRYKNFYQSYYDSLAGTSYDKFNRIELGLCIGRFEAVESLLSGITPTNSVEQAYFDFYSLQLKSLTDTLNSSDSTALYYLANSCPSNGTAIYHARALYNYLYNVAGDYSDACGGALRESNNGTIGYNNKNLAETMDYKLYPNPASNMMVLTGGIDTEKLTIKLIDISGKMIFERDLVVQGSKAVMELDLKEGVYFVTITNSRKEKTVKKLVIAK